VLATTLDRLPASQCYEVGSMLLELGAPHDAGRCFRRVTTLLPKDPAPRAALAGALRASGHPEAAWPEIQRALRHTPNHPAFLLTAAQVRHDLADLTGAQTFLKRAHAVRPDHQGTRVQQAYTTLLAGSSAEGWTLFESRPLPEPNTGARPWHGEPLQEESILVTAEQGVGDQFQFARFIPALRAHGAGRVIVQCHADAVSLFRDSGFDAVARDTVPATTWHVPMMSLPARLSVGSDVAPPQGNAYLTVSAEARALAPSLPARRSTHPRRLGLVWSGNPAFVGRATRDLPDDLLPDLLAMPDIEWVILQHGRALPTAVLECPHALRVSSSSEWRQTAALLASVDGLVTTDTGIAHLAGALGVPTWTMLQHVPDWRWGLSGDTTPWYPHMTLLRQPRARDWASVVDQLRTVLASS
jgi:Glycosyltransferase family 9 (heptosyltransferase)